MSHQKSHSKRWLLACLFWLVGPASAHFGDYRSHHLRGSTLVISTTQGDVRIQALVGDAMEVHYLETGVKQLPSFALDPDRLMGGGRLEDFENRLHYSSGELTAVIHKSPFKLSYLRDGRRVVEEESGYFAEEALRGFRFRLNSREKIIGGGQRVLGMDRRGQRMPLYNKAHYGYTTESDQMYYGLPAVFSSEKYILVFDNSARGHLDIGASEPNVLQFEAVAGRTAYLIVTGQSYPDLITNYTSVTGRQPLPPRWAFGNFASRFGYRSEEQARDVVRRFQREKIPLDAIVLDLYWFGPDLRGTMGNLDWDRNTFPNAEKMIADFSAAGVKTIPITEPNVLTQSSNWQSAIDQNALALNPAGQPKRFDFFFGNTGLIDVFSDEGRRWFWAAYQRLFEQGVGGVWGDLGEPEVHPPDSFHRLSDEGLRASSDEVHNAFGHKWTELIYQKQIENFSETRPFIMMRSGFAGTQRFGVMPWTGDVSRSWGGLKPQVELSLQMGLLGLAYNHSDLGGFAGGDGFDRELYIRWLQYGVFQPVYRPHAHESIAPEPVFHDRKTRRIVGDAIRLRYRMLPYNYTLAYLNSTTGIPLMRPLFFEDESDLSLIDHKMAFFWGDALLVAPVTDPRARSVSVPLPRGVWFDFWDDRRIDGGRTVAVPVTLKTIPVLVRAGSFIPMTGDIATTRDYSSQALTLHYYTDETATESNSMMYEDDGTTRGSLAGGQYEILEFAALRDPDRLAIELIRRGAGYPGGPASRDLTLVIHNWTQPVDQLFVGQQSVSVQKKEFAKDRGASPRALINADKRQLTLRFKWNYQPLQIRIN